MAQGLRVACRKSAKAAATRKLQPMSARIRELGNEMGLCAAAQALRGRPETSPRPSRIYKEAWTRSGVAELLVLPPQGRDRCSS